MANGEIACVPPMWPRFDPSLVPIKCGLSMLFVLFPALRAFLYRGYSHSGISPS